MEKYKIVKSESKFHIMETDNDYIIRIYDNYNNAKKIKHKLNNGSGFDGFTPLFFTENYSTTKYNKTKEE